MIATKTLKQALEESRGKKSLFMAHMIAGFPTMKESLEVAKALVNDGADIIEVQIPFSDPMADGPTIAIASEDALKKGATVEKAIGVVEKVSKLGKPVVVMSYINPVFRYGIEKFVKRIAHVGASGIIVPDCPFDTKEGWELIASCQSAGIALIPVVSPGVPQERLTTLAQSGSGFWYCTTRQGITGATSMFSSVLPRFVNLLRNTSDLPIAVGFGVKTRNDVKKLSKFADIVIAGSVFVETARKRKSSLISKIVKELTH